MSNGNRKSPFSDVTDGDEKDWDKALNAWEVPAGVPGDPKEAAAEVPKISRPPPAVPPRPSGPSRPAGAEPSRPVTVEPSRPPAAEPSRPAAETSRPPPGSEWASRSSPSEDDDDAEDATIVARISPELLASAIGPGTSETDIDRLLAPTRPTPHIPGEPADALLDMLFEDPAGLARPAHAIDDARKESETDPFAAARVEQPSTVGSGDEPSEVRATLTQSEFPTSRALTPVAMEDDLKDSMPPVRISLDSVPPDSLPPPSFELPGGLDLRGVEPSELSPLVRTLQGGLGLPPVRPAIRELSERAPQPPALETLDRPSEPGAAVSSDPQQLEKWRERAAFIENEARSSPDRDVKARGLLVASEIFALVADDLHSHELAIEARDLSPMHPLLHRQARALSVREGDFEAVAVALQAESRSASTPAARVHGAIFAAEIARVALGDEELAHKRLEQALRAAPGDVRAYVNRIANALGESQPLPKIRWPEGGELAPLVEAASTLARWHGASDQPVAFANPVDALIRARATLRARDPEAALDALDALAETAGLGETAGWLTAAIALAHGIRDDALRARLDRLAHGGLARLARRALVARALEKGQNVEAIGTLAEAGEQVFDAKERAVIAVLAGADLVALERWLRPLDGDPEAAPLADAIRAALGDSLGGSQLAEETSAARLSAYPAVQLSRMLAARASPEKISRALDNLEKTGASALVRVLRAEIDIDTGEIEALAESLSRAGDDDAHQKDRGLLAGLLFELAERNQKARALYDEALHADKDCEAAARARIAVSGPDERATLLEELANALDDASRGALVLLEAAHGRGDGSDPETYSRLLKLAHEKAPSLPFASWLAERRARTRGDSDNIVEWLRERRQASDDRIDQAYDLVREALLVADRDLDAARDLLEQASHARPVDLALRELYERLSPEPPEDRAAFWAERATAATGSERARLALSAALEYERSGNYEQAARLSQLSLQAEDNAFARLTAERNEARGGLSTLLAERLFEHARATEDVNVRVEAYERLAELDEVVRVDIASALLWHRSILEQRPGFLPSLSRLQQWLISDGREDDLEPIAAELAKALDGPEASAHAHLATRLRTRAGPWQSGAPYVKLAFSQPDPPLWALRQMEAHASLANDSASELAVARTLLERTSRPLEIATLCLRAANAAKRAGEPALAQELLARAANAHPTHLVVHRSLAELCEETGDHPSAAEAWEAVATMSGVAAHQLEANYNAAVIWLDHVKDATRGRMALETAAQIDVTYRDVFTRLQTIYIAVSDRAALASLLEARLATVQDAGERIELEVVRGRTLAEIGDADAAKRALSYALEASPDHADALAAYADLCAAESDWLGAEQALIRLARLVPDPIHQASIYARLGALYDEHLPNPDRAELAYREVLKRQPADVIAQEKLVEVYRRKGDAPRGIEIQEGLLRAATTPEDKRRRTVELAGIYEHVARDPKKAEALLESARREFPIDVELLSAVAAFYARGNRMPALQVLLDRAAGDARRALSTGRFDVALFSMLGRVAKLRDRTQAARIAEATVAAIEGRPSGLGGAEERAADPRLDDLLAPELLTPAFRSLLYKSGEILDAAAPVDLKGLRATPLPQNAVGTEIRQLGASFGLAGLEAYVSSTLGSVCMPVGSHPPQIVMGQSLLASSEDETRRFLVRRALKAVQARASALSRSAPIDLLPLVSAYLLLFAPDWQPTAVDPSKLHDVHSRLLRAKPKRLDEDVGLLALEVIGSLGNRASTLHTVVNGWGNRVGLVACGDLSVAFAAIARAAGHASGPAPRGPERLTWINRNSEARDLAVFSVSDAHAEVRSKLGV